MRDISGTNKFGGKNAVVGELGRTAVLQQGVLLRWAVQQHGVGLLFGEHVGGVELSVEERKLQVFLIRPAIHLPLLLCLLRHPLRQKRFLAEETVALGCWFFTDLQMMHLQQVLPPVPFLLTSPRKQKLLLLPGLRLLHSQIARLQLCGLVVLMP